MAFTCDITTNRGKVRRNLGDTNEAKPAFTDAEIDEALSIGGTVEGATVVALRWAIADRARAAALYATPTDGQSVPDHATTIASLQALLTAFGGDGAIVPRATFGSFGAHPSDGDAAPRTLPWGRC